MRTLAPLIGGVSDDALADARAAIRTDLRHNISGEAGIGLSVAREVYSWLSLDAADRVSLQWRAERIWREFRELAKAAGRSDG
jgi:hypothetical protein